MDAVSRRIGMTRRLYLLYVLNLADWLCTVALVRTGGFYEANPLMRPVIDSLPLGVLIKGVVPALVITAVIRLIHGMDRDGLIFVDRALAFVMTIYAALCAGHIVNFVLLFWG